MYQGKFHPPTCFIVSFIFHIEHMVCNSIRVVLSSLTLFPFFLIPELCIAQEVRDTVPVLELQGVVVKAYEQNSRLRDVPAAVSYIGARTLQRFGASSIVQAVNTIPGVRMEERSPGSYRFNIRGSALRSPFGVRNVKVYYNDLPLTHPGGHTYLNGLGYYNFSSIEVIKGPGSSLYGAGTGGVVLAEALSSSEKAGLSAEITIGSYGLRNVYGSIITGDEKFRSKIAYQHQQSDGYRVHSALRRDVFSHMGQFDLGDAGAVKTTFLYSDLFYQTPGALTAAEYAIDPKAARPGNAFFPGAVAAGASVRQKTIFTGAVYTRTLTGWLASKTALYGSHTQLENPAIQNYGRILEPHYGGRTTFTINPFASKPALVVNAGVEWQQGFTTSSVHRNRGGSPDTLQQSYDVANRQSIIFTQAVWNVGKFTAVAGVSNNHLRIRYKTFYPGIASEQRKALQKWAPRFALLHKWKDVAVYASIAKGFSPPATEEFFPSGGTADINLNAEDGTNWDAGIRGAFKGLTIDINAFYFRLRNSIVQQRTAGGGSQYLNAGSTSQKGVETTIQYPFLSATGFLRESNLWLSHTYHVFKYATFKKDTVSYSGKRLPGIAPHSLFAGWDAEVATGFLLSLTYQYAGRVPLTDANTVFATDYNLVGARIGYRQTLRQKWAFKLTVGGDNLLGENYSLGNDINGFNGRYFNAAPGRNYYCSLSMQWVK
jgi:iron complex outermembrane receptor protein